MNDSKVYEMLWDCKYCGTNKLLGLSHRYCPNCGAAQDPDTRYYPSDEEKVAVEDHVYHGVDVTCSSCGELNSAKSEYCGQCGAPLTDAAKARTLEAQSRGEGERFASSGSRDLEKEEFEREMQRAGVRNKPKTKRSGGINWIAIAAIIVVLGMVAGGIFLLNWTEETSVVVSAHEWERSIDIDSYQSFSVRAWEDQVPSGFEVRKSNCTREQRDTKRIADGETCTVRRVDQGDGTYREVQDCQTTYREEPVYDNKCTFSGFHWDYERTVSTAGTFEDIPYWGDLNLRCENTRRIGCEKEGRRDATYRVLYAGDDGTPYTCEYSQSEWEQIPAGTRYTGEVRVIDNSALLCDTLKRQ